MSMFIHNGLTFPTSTEEPSASEWLGDVNLVYYVFEPYIIYVKRVNKKLWIYLRIIPVLTPPDTKNQPSIEYQRSNLVFLDSYVSRESLPKLLTLIVILSPELTRPRVYWQDSTIFITDHCISCYEDWAETNESSLFTKRQKQIYMTGTNSKWDGCFSLLSSSWAREVSRSLTQR